MKICGVVGNMAQKKSRLQRKPMGMKKTTRMEGLDLTKQMKDLSNVQVEAYAKQKAVDPISKAVKEAATKEVQRRNLILAKWKKGGEVAAKKPLFELPKPAELPREAIKGVRKGVGFLGKAISGELAREFQEDIETVGMKPEQKAAWRKEQKAKERKRIAAERKEEREMRQFGFG